MDSGRVLVALEEQSRWRERRTRIQARLREVQARKRYLQRELEEARRRLAQLEDASAGPPGPTVTRPPHLTSFDNLR